MQVGVEIVRDVDWTNGSSDLYLASPADFYAGANDIITNLGKESEPGIEIIERTPLIVTTVEPR